MAANSNMENLPPHIIRQVWRELSTLSMEPPEGIHIYTNEEDITDLRATIEGPDGTPYAGGLFKMKLVLGRDFPACPPKAYFVTKIFHPNVGASGEICVNVLKRDWRAELGIRHILLTIKCLLIHPNPESALNEEAGRLLLEEYGEYASRARLLTEIHARGGRSRDGAALPPPPSTSSSSASSLCSGGVSDGLGLPAPPPSPCGTPAHHPQEGPTAKKHAGDKKGLGPPVSSRKKSDKKRMLRRL
ncbi:ubiquitin-conjugating enzyme E2 S [Hemiscyllium ocellatum]|uniref:ubiquitin-conjugating enzyme E2 S n=1 Tax=Hemiscyllium ocellatum TaxID=170820 RepID=UPI002965FEB8|nr:ubiquitin-conjugating enzyme E2 S [Hemiscyllium ocellatum]